MSVLDQIREFIQKALRVLRVCYRPTTEEFYTTVKITALGMVLIGLVGYIISVIFGFLSRGGSP